jgi:hypothetical protein
MTVPAWLQFRDARVRNDAYPARHGCRAVPDIVTDCPDPSILAQFYGAMLDWKVDVSPGWAEVRAD